MGAVSGAVVVSEPMYKPDPWVAGTHFAEAPLSDFPALIARLLADEAERGRLAAAAAALVEQHTLAASARALADLMAATEATG